MSMTAMYEDTNKQAELRRMKLSAAALFWFVTIIFVLASTLEDQYFWMGFVRATAEAAMVGAIADWFAVTALFRHPMGLKIPHTAIIPSRKDSIGQRFGRFVKSNFLSGEVIGDRLRTMDVTKRVAKWISRPENSELIAGYVAVGLAAVVQVIKDEAVQEIIEHNITIRIRSTQIAPLLGNGISLVLSGHRQQELLHGMLNLGAHLLDENKDVIQKRIGEETPWWLPQTVDNVIYQKIVDAVEKMLREVSSDPNHPLHADFDAVVSRFVEDLKHSPDVVAREEAFKEEFLQHPIVREFSASLWLDIKMSLIEHSAIPDSDLRKPIQQGIMHFGKAILDDEILLEKIDQWVQEGAVYLIKEYGDEVEHLISNTISKWDAEETSRKIELHVGKDLQFIRINGTIVGGLAGLVIHTFSLLLR